MSELYTCANCGDPCGANDEWSDEDAEREMRAMWGDDVKKEDCDVLCDDCFEKFSAWLKANEGRA